MTSGAVFLDRDGVINPSVFNPVTGAWESPHHPDDFHLARGVVAALGRLKAAGLPLFLVSNQPSYAKGKTSLEAIQAIAARCERLLAAAGLGFTASYYCFHHPDGVVAGYSGACPCRKPSPHALLDAARRFDLDLSRSWMVGDRDSDVECGRRAGARTIRIAPDHPGAPLPAVPADAEAAHLAQAVALILSRGRSG